MSKKKQTRPEQQNTETNQQMNHVSDSMIMPTQKKKNQGQNQSQNCTNSKNCR